MRIQVLAFARVREILGAAGLPVDVADATTARQVWAMLAARHEALESLTSSIRFARNGTIVAADVPLHDGDEVAFLPPVSGG